MRIKGTGKTLKRRFDVIATLLATPSDIHISREMEKTYSLV